MKNQVKWILFSVLIFCCASSFAADPYTPFNTPACLTSQVIPASQLPGREGDQSGSYVVQLSNNCGVDLPIMTQVQDTTTGACNVYPLTIKTDVGAGTFKGYLLGTKYIPENQIASDKAFPYLAANFWLYANGTVKTGTDASAFGDMFKLYYDGSKDPTSDGAYPTENGLCWTKTPIALTVGNWYALFIGTNESENTTVNLVTPSTVPKYNVANITFAQTATELGLPPGSDLVVTLDFAADPNSTVKFLGKYNWRPLEHPVLAIPVSVKTTDGRNDVLNVSYTIQPTQAPTPKGFAWQGCTTTSTPTATLPVDSQAGAPFPTLAKFECTVGTAAIKHTGIEGMPLKIDDDAGDGLLNDINNLNPAVTGVIVGFANVLTSDGSMELGAYKKNEADIASWQNNILDFQNSAHVMLISFGGEQVSGTSSIVAAALKQMNPNAAQLNCSSAAACDAVLDQLDPPNADPAKNKLFRTTAIANYEILISRYKPNGIDVFPLPADLTPLGNEFTAQVLKTVMADVTADTENPNFVLSLTLQPFSQTNFDDQTKSFKPNNAFMNALANQGITPTYINAVYRQFFTATKPTSCDSKFVSGACIVDSLTDYIAEYNAIWPPVSHTIYAGIMPMALEDYSDKVEIWPANIQTDPVQSNQLDNIFAAILTAESADKNIIGFPPSVLFSYWNTTSDFAGGKIAHSYPSNEYQLELASYANTPYVDPSPITWNPSALTVISTDNTSGEIRWGAATPAAGGTISYNAVLYDADENVVANKTDITSPYTFAGLTQGTSYKVVLTATDDKNSKSVWRVTWFQTTGKPTIEWATPNVMAQGNSDGASGFATWNCATDSDVTAVLSYTVTIDGGGAVGTVDPDNCKVNFTNLKVATTYNVTVSVSDNKQGIVPTTSPAKTSFTTTKEAPAALKAPTKYTWDPKPDHTGILTFDAATGGLPPYTYTMIISPTGSGTSLPFTQLTSCPYTDCSAVNTDNMYRVTSMVFGVSYTVSILVTDAAGQPKGMQMFAIMDSN